MVNSALGISLEVLLKLESDGTSLVTATDDLLWESFFMMEKIVIFPCPAISG